MIYYGILFVATAWATKLFADYYGRLARRLGIVAYPDNERRLQKKPIPTGGGIVILAVVFCVAAITSFFDENLSLLKTPIVSAAAISSLIILAVGLYDDRCDLSGGKKLFFQILVATFLAVCAKNYSRVEFFGYELDLGRLFLPVAILWVVSLINAFNFLDGADGVVALYGFYASLAAGAIALINGVYQSSTLAILSLLFAASLLGFFWNNKPPAKIYMGDAGSLFIGLVVPLFLFRVSVAPNNALQITPVICVLILPIMDCVCSFIRRMNPKRGLFTPDRGHIHHIVQRKIGDGYALLAVMSFLEIISCVAGVLGIYYRNEWIPLLTAISIPLGLIVSGLFGRDELLVLVKRLEFLYIKQFRKKRFNRFGETFHVQGTVDWLDLWNDVLLKVKGLPCLYISLDVNMPYMGEDYFSEWRNVDDKTVSDKMVFWSFPLSVQNLSAGNIKFQFCIDETIADDLAIAARVLVEDCNRFIGERFVEFQRRGRRS